MRTITTEKATTEIRRAYSTYQTLPGTDGWMAISELAQRVDLTLDEIHDGIRHLARHANGFSLVPTSNQKTLSSDDHKMAVWFGGQWKHVFAWN